MTRLWEKEESAGAEEEGEVRARVTHTGLPKKFTHLSIVFTLGFFGIMQISLSHITL